MNLYLVHCGFYDTEVGSGIYEFHTNIFVAAENFDDARARVRQVPEFQAKRMHVDGLQQVVAVDGFAVEMKADAALEGKTVLHHKIHRDLAPKPATAPSLTQ